MSKKIVLIPIGPVPSELLSWLADRLAELFDRCVVIGGTTSLPADGYNARRHQYEGDSMLAALESSRYPDADRLLGLTDVDCYTPCLNFIFGLATLCGRTAFVAVPRLRQSFYGLPEEQALFYERALKEVVHELGHTWGLSHCSDASCVMHFSNSLDDTDIKGADLCSRCKERVDFEKKNC